MKTFAELLSVVLLLSACSGGGYVIKGNVKHLDEGNINLLDQYGHTVCNAEVKDGRFEFRGRTEVPILAYVNNALGVSYPIDVPVMLENRRIRIIGDASLSMIKVTGTGPNDDMMEYKARRDALAPDDSEGYLALVREMSDRNADNILGAMLISNLYGLVDSEELLERCNRLPAELREDKSVSFYMDISRGRVETREGQTFKDLQMRDSDGTLRKLSDSVNSGKATILLFWVSWNRNNGELVPGVGELSRLYSGRGLNLFSISTDHNPDVWRKSVEKYGLEGINLQGNPAEADSLAKLYGVDGMPRAILIGSDGKIMKRCSRIEELSSFIDVFSK